MDFPPEPYAPAFELARTEGLASVPHAGEIAVPASIRGALDALHANRIRHGIRAVDCPVSNVRTGAVPSLQEHPLRELAGAGVRCSVSTDDPAMFDTDLEREYEAAASLGLEPRRAYENGVAGALCDDTTRERLRSIGESFDWRSLP